MSINKPVYSGHTLDTLYQCVRYSKGLEGIPILVKRIITEKLWEEVYIEEFEEIKKYENFEDYITTAPPEGVGTSIDTILRLCKDDNETVNLIDREVKRRNTQGQRNDLNVNFVDNVNEVRPTGNTQQAGIRRLRSEIDKAETKERKQELQNLQQQVFNNEISVHRALITIGARKETVTIPINPKKAAKIILKRFTARQVIEIVELISH